MRGYESYDVIILFESIVGFFNFEVYRVFIFVKSKYLWKVSMCVMIWVFVNFGWVDM